jgi:pilus assembly protein TadC
MKLYKVIVIIIIMEPIIIFIIIFSSFVGIVVSVKLYNKYCKQKPLDDSLLSPYYYDVYPKSQETLTYDNALPTIINENIPL